jgi:hypothetical protein
MVVGIYNFVWVLNSTKAKGHSTWWLEGAGGTPQVGGSTFSLGLKKSHSPISHKAHGKARPCVVMGYGLLCMGG